MSVEARRPLPVRIFVAVAAAVVMLLLGAALGLLIRVPSFDSAEPQPAAVDVGFAQDMSVHHQQAVTMATLAREHAADVAVRQLAFDIETNQRDQIGRMQGWLSLWGQPAQAVGPLMTWMTEDGGHQHSAPAAAQSESGGLMPGMATSAEMSRLQSLRGPDFDVYFLQLMLRHHEGGAPMADYGATHAGVPAVRELAKNMLGSQRSESDLMRSMLAERGAQPLR
ncbi:Uncharacterized conserved protein, DUF305 family [Saccharopolyspora shandongensis]|uniref:Uncharacterized conserved protein, DUF305 family n=1 Tax=Saccharopolyspora shandongensis TaxID=418495 RepID=A0A1H3LGR8_9PSEU|nr:DUF305 domain-containing protein [Saccharopolyspora shandongensis]SDY63727.1 Uncharacterized conserved protein, DUF305 family [Saccharopolyspora shandongensis]